MQITRVKILIISGSSLLLLAWMGLMFLIATGMTTVLHSSPWLTDQYLHLSADQPVVDQSISQSVNSGEASNCNKTGINMKQTNLLAFDGLSLIACQMCHPWSQSACANDIETTTVASTREHLQEMVVRSDSHLPAWGNMVTCTSCHNHVFLNLSNPLDINSNRMVDLNQGSVLLDPTVPNSGQPIRQQTHTQAILDCWHCHIGKSIVAHWRVYEKE